MICHIVFSLSLYALQTFAHAPNNDTEPFIRTFSGFFLTFTDEPIDYLDVQDGSGSGISSDIQKKHRVPSGKTQHYVSKEASLFLKGKLATAFVPTVYTLVFIISLPLNLVAVVMFVRRIRPRKPAVIYMLNLAAADLLFTLLLPFRIAYHFHGNNWVYGSAMCRLVTGAFYCNMYCSVLLMMCISIDRFLAVVYPMDSLTWRSPQNATVICVGMWLLSIGGVLPLLLSDQSIRLPDLAITTCHDVQDVQKLRGYYLYFFPIFSSVFFFIPLFFTAACYVRIVQALTTAVTENRHRRTRAVVMAVTVLAVFVLCFTPTNVILLVHYVQVAHGHSDSSYAAYLLSMCVGSVSCALDPLIYYFGSSQCQKQVAALLGCRTRQEGEGSSQSGSTRTSKMEVFQSTVGRHYKKLMG